MVPIFVFNYFSNLIPSNFRAFTLFFVPAKAIKFGVDALIDHGQLYDVLIGKGS